MLQDAEVSNSTGTDRMCVQLSWDGGTTWTTSDQADLTSTSETTLTLGSSIDLWGRGWTTSELSDANFRVRVTNVSDNNADDFEVDAVSVRVHWNEPAPTSTPTETPSPTESLSPTTTGTATPTPTESAAATPTDTATSTATLTPTATLTIMPTETTTPTSTDTPHPSSVDSDGDGCSDEEELGSNPALGGQRDRYNPYDFFDTPVLDGSISVGDIAQLVARFGYSTGSAGCSEAYDRTLVGPLPWDLGPPNGSVTVQDVALIVAQFGHSCVGPQTTT
jgi:hypothetical protein